MQNAAPPALGRPCPRSRPPPPACRRPAPPPPGRSAPPARPPPLRARRPDCGRRGRTSSCAQRFLEPGPETGALLGRGPLDLGELLEQPALLGVQRFGRPDVDPHVEVAGAPLAQPRQPLASNPQY